MKVYVDVFSGDEIVSDSFNLEPVFGGVGGEFTAKYIVAGGVDVDVGCGNAFGGTEEGDEGTDD